MMDSPIQDDPYEALGVTKASTAADIKTAYRKLVLKSHPDKFPDPTTKQQKADEFHKIQQAYEILNDEEKRSRYDARIRLAELKAEMMRREGGRESSSKSSRYDVRPSAASYPSFSRSTTAAFEVRTPRYTDEFFDEPKSATRRQDSNGSYYRRSSPPRVKPERERRTEKDDKSRSERRRTRDEQVRDARDRKYYTSPTDEINERAKYEEDRKRRDDVVKQKEEEARRFMKMEESRREEARRTAVKNVYENQRAAATSYDVKLEDARRHMATAEQTYSTTRPPMERRSATQHYDIRRSRARPSERRRSPEIVEDRVPTSFAKSATTAEIRREMAGERGMPPRSHSHIVASQDRDYAVPPAPMRRADTMPAKTTSSSRREKESTRSSRPRQVDPLQPDSGYSSSSPTSPESNNPYLTAHHPDIPPANMSTASVNRTLHYHYPSPGATPERVAVSTSPDKYAAFPSYKTELRIPASERGRDKDRERRRERERPPIASARTIPTPSGNHLPYSHVRPPTYSHRSPEAERERDRVRAADRDNRRSEKTREMEYAELPSDYTRRHEMQPKSYKDNEINVAKRYDYGDIAFSGSTRSRGGRDDSYVRKHRYSDEKERYDRPGMTRSATIAIG